jgi:PAS domain S-box-containing protein
MIDNQFQFHKDNIFAVFDNFTDGLLVFDKDTKLSLINTAVEKIFGFEKENLLNKTIEEFADIEPLNNLFYLLGKDIKTVFRKELEINKNLILEITSSPIMKQKEQIGNLVILHNITREKRIERMKNEFVTISAHQLRTPLSAIQWSLERLLSGKPGKLTEEQKSVIERAFNDNKRMVNLINDLLNLVKIEEGKDVYNLSPQRLEKLVQSVIKYYQEKLERKEIKFQFQVLNKLPKIRVDEEKIKFVIENLLDNAIKYTPIGGMVTISLELIDKKIEFSVQDNGIGIPETQKESIFGKFFRASNAIKIETEGNGTGLFIAKNIIEAHQGEIWFKSEENKGTIFYFNLPANSK